MADPPTPPSIGKLSHFMHVGLQGEKIDTLHTHTHKLSELLPLHVFFHFPDLLPLFALYTSRYTMLIFISIEHVYHF